MNKQGGILSIIVWLASVLVIIFILAGFLYFSAAIQTALQDAGSTIDSSAVNLTDATNKVFVPFNQGMNSLTWISFILITVLAFAILIENFYIREHPVLFFVHFMIVIAGIVAAIYISNWYETFLDNAILGPTLARFTAANYVALYLPWWVALIGVFGLVLLVINVSRDPEMRFERI